MNKIIAMLLCLLLIFPASAFANTPDEEPGLDLGTFTLLKQGQEAPFAGFLFDQQSMAKILANTEFKELELKLRHDFELSKSNALWQLKLDNSQAAKDALEERHNSLMKIKDDEITRLKEISLEQPNDYSHWWFAGGVAAGVLLCIGVFYAASEGFKN